MDEITISLKLLSDYKLSLEAYLVLVCVYKNDKQTLERYVLKCRTIPFSIFEDLINRDLIIFSGEDIEKLTFKQIKLGNSKEISELFPDTDIKQLFEEFKQVYPKKVITKTGETRQLHLDKKRCEKLYEKIVCPSGKVDINIHKELIAATKRMVEDKTRSGSLGYLQLMGTYLHQQNYEAYIEDSKTSEEDSFKQRI